MSSTMKNVMKKLDIIKAENGCQDKLIELPQVEDLDPDFYAQGMKYKN